MIDQSCLELSDVTTVGDVVAAARERFGDQASEFEKLSRVAALAVNGVLVNYRQGMRTQLEDGDVVSFVKAAAGG